MCWCAVKKLLTHSPCHTSRNVYSRATSTAFCLIWLSVLYPCLVPEPKISTQFTTEVDNKNCHRPQRTRGDDHHDTLAFLMTSLRTSSWRVTPCQSGDGLANCRRVPVGTRMMYRQRWSIQMQNIPPRAFPPNILPRLPLRKGKRLANSIHNPNLTLTLTLRLNWYHYRVFMPHYASLCFLCHQWAAEALYSGRPARVPSVVR